MIFKWFESRSNANATLKAIFIAAGAGEPMQSVNTVSAVPNRGLEGDRYSKDLGHWKSIDGCQVTLITEYDLDLAKKAAVEFQSGLDQGSHRRNLVVAGLKIKQLEGKEFRIGTAVFRYAKPRPPCAYLDKIAGKGMCRALGTHSGVCIRVVTGGRLAVGDALQIIEPAVRAASDR